MVISKTLPRGRRLGRTASVEVVREQPAEAAKLDHATATRTNHAAKNRRRTEADRRLLQGWVQISIGGAEPDGIHDGGTGIWIGLANRSGFAQSKGIDLTDFDMISGGGLFKFLLSTCGICTVLDLVSVPIDTAL